MADFCAAAVLISFGAVIGKASLSQLIIMATFEVVIQGVNELIGLHYLKVKFEFYLKKNNKKLSRLMMSENQFTCMYSGLILA